MKAMSVSWNFKYENIRILAFFNTVYQLPVVASVQIGRLKMILYFIRPDI